MATAVNRDAMMTSAKNIIAICEGTFVWDDAVWRTRRTVAGFYTANARIHCAANTLHCPGATLANKASVMSCGAENTFRNPKVPCVMYVAEEVVGDLRGCSEPHFQAWQVALSVKRVLVNAAEVLLDS